MVALAKYVDDADGRPWAVALTISDEDANRARPVLDAPMAAIARHGRRATGLEGRGDGGSGSGGRGP